MDKVYELIIIGSGAAGLTAGIYAGRALIDTLVIEKLPVSGGQIIRTNEIDNYPGLPGISGTDLGQRLKEHINQYEVEHVNGEVAKFEVKGDIKEITLDNNKVYRGKAVLIATGADPRKLGIDGEEKLQGLGVSYCATCDGAFFRNRVAAVVGGGDTAVEDALFLSRICDKVYLIHRRDEFRAAKIYLEKVKVTPNIEIITDSVVEEIIGDDIVEKIKVRNVKNQEVNELEVNALFVAIGNKPNTEVFKDIIDLDPNGYIIANEEGTTSVPGIFAAGDVRTKTLRQVITAASDGANAISSVEKYLNSLN
ncbi:MAG: thioredoxin-disulfide reductase [Clostridiales bacterium]|nr:thioredoxin-disulfide reductase [Clostridiales bacterium]